MHVWLYRVTGGKLGGRLSGAPVLLLTTVGRQSGKERTIPLSYSQNGDEIVICAANLGSDRHPGWFWNLTGNPNVRIEKDGERATLTARVATSEERGKLWQTLIKELPALVGYQNKTDRTLPVVVLAERTDDEPPDFGPELSSGQHSD